jgi:CheY-like chemotaxis protein
MIKFEFFEHNSTSYAVEITRRDNPLGHVFAAALLDDASVRFEAGTQEQAFELLKAHIIASTRPSLGATRDAKGKQPADTTRTQIKAKREPLRLDRPATILVVDDNPASARIAISVCEMLGHYAVGAREGNEALHWLNTRPFDLVLTDLHMPVMGGVALVQYLRASPAGQALPLIAVTAAGPNGIKALWDVGIDLVVRKPYEAQELADAIRALIQPAA